MPNAKVQSSNECQNPKAKDDVFDIEAFGFGLTFPLGAYPSKSNLNTDCTPKIILLKVIVG
jgi:hypothetical protein